MNKPTYQTRTIADNIYTFTSVGKKGIILKVVIFTEISPNLYNLGFGDYDFKNESIDDEIESKNGDMEKILATVIAIVGDFLTINSTSTIFLTGSTPIRTRLYQIAISKYFEEFSNFYQIKGSIDGNSEKFQKDKNYESFLIQKLF
jgi:hypothetical protein